MAASTTVVTKRIARTDATAIQQRMAAGQNFTGALPQAGGHRADSPVGIDAAIYKYAPLAASGGGLFFWNTYEPLVCSQIHVDLGVGGSGDISVSLVNLDPAHLEDDLPSILAGESLLIEQASGVRFIALDESRFKTILLPYQGIQVITTNSSQAQIVQVVASLERTYVR